MTGKILTLSVLILTSTALAAPAAGPTLTLDLGNGVTMELILVPKGTFQQGSPADEPGRGEDETQRQVTIGSDFYLGKYPVTRGQFAQFVRATNHRTDAERGPSGGYGFDGKELVQRKEFTWRNPGFVQTDVHPITLVTYDDAQAFLTWLSQRARRKLALPTEAQWEYACRAGSTTAYANGGTPEDAQALAWFKANAGDGTRPVDQKKPNAFGLHDLSGNVWEWCQDWYGPYEPGPVTDPVEMRNDHSDQPRRVLRGGSWLREAKHARSAARYRNAPGSRNADNGFRVMAPIEVTRAEAEGPTKPAPATQQASSHEHGDPSPAGHSWFSTLCMGVCCIGTIGGGIALVIFIIRSLGKSRGRTNVPPSRERLAAMQRTRPRVVSDGFWLDGLDLATGSIIRYRCLIDGEDRRGEITTTPGPRGQFIYTGGRPTDIEVLEIIPQVSAAEAETDSGYWSDPLRTGPSVPPPRPRDDPPPEPFRGYPSAY